MLQVPCSPWLTAVELEFVYVDRLGLNSYA